MSSRVSMPPLAAWLKRPSEQTSRAYASQSYQQQLSPHVAPPPSSPSSAATSQDGHCVHQDSGTPASMTSWQVQPQSTMMSSQDA